jgi:hypothetical protein
MIAVDPEARAARCASANPAPQAGYGGQTARRSALWTTAFWSSLCLFLLCSCTTNGPNGSLRKHYFGYTVVTFPRQTGNCKSIDARDVTNVGVSLCLPAGLAIGYNKDKIVALSPDGRVLIEIQTDEQFEAAKKFIKEISSIGICAIQSTESSSTTKQTP